MRCSAPRSARSFADGSAGGAVLGGGCDQRFEERLFGVLLGVPEDADRERPSRVLHALERSVVGACRLA